MGIWFHNMAFYCYFLPSITWGVKLFCPLDSFFRNSQKLIYNWLIIVKLRRLPKCFNINQQKNCYTAVNFAYIELKFVENLAEHMRASTLHKILNVFHKVWTKWLQHCHFSKYNILAGKLWNKMMTSDMHSFNEC